MRDTDYAQELITTSDEYDQHIELLHIKEYDRQEIRFSYWKNGRMVLRPLDIPESELLPLLKQAIQAEVFSDEFLDDLRDYLVRRRDAAPKNRL